MTRKIMVGDPLGEARLMADTILKDIQSIFVGNYPLVKGEFISKVRNGRIGFIFKITDLGPSDGDTIQRIIGQRIAHLVTIYKPKNKIVGLLTMPPKTTTEKDGEA